jgi:hypothetical protein
VSKSQARKANQELPARPVAACKGRPGRRRQQQASGALSEKLERAAKLLISGDESAPEHYRKGFGTAADGLRAAFPGVRVTSDETEATLTAAEAPTRSVAGKQALATRRYITEKLETGPWRDLALKDPRNRKQLLDRMLVKLRKALYLEHGISRTDRGRPPNKQERDGRIYRRWIGLGRCSWRRLRLYLPTEDQRAARTLQGICEKQEKVEIDRLARYLQELWGVRG